MDRVRQGTGMESDMVLGVYRRLDNRLEALSDDSPRALELHIRRGLALHDVLDDSLAVTVADWGATDDTKPREYVELILGVASTIFTYAIVPGLKLVGKKLTEKGADEGASRAVQWLISKLRPKRERKEILDFQIRLPDGTQIHVDLPGEDKVNISFADGTVSSV